MRKKKKKRRKQIGISVITKPVFQRLTLYILLMSAIVEDALKKCPYAL